MIIYYYFPIDSGNFVITVIKFMRTSGTTTVSDSNDPKSYIISIIQILQSFFSNSNF